jgi:TetR/AcrR family transcriptional repressor of bet genes
MTIIMRERPERVRRKASRDVRRQQLIEAAIDVIGCKGYASTTIADVAKTAQLSAGIISFHFDGKDRLLAACLQYLADEYYANWKAHLERAAPSAAARLEAVLLADFSDEIYTPEKLAAWIAFWGETQGRPIYEKICSPHDEEHARTVMQLCADLCAEGGYLHNPQTVMIALETMCEGLWLGVVSTSARIEPYIDAVTARRVVRTGLAAFFPKHFQAL